MRSLYIRIYLTVVTVLALFAVVSGWLVQRHLQEQRQQVEGSIRERLETSARARAEAWGDLLEKALPPATAEPPWQASRRKPDAPAPSEGGLEGLPAQPPPFPPVGPSPAVVVAVAPERAPTEAVLKAAPLNQVAPVVVCVPPPAPTWYWIDAPGVRLRFSTKA